tara:strand:- start:1187 stop:1408 length:222 start_codon:yes stop_codon:yes gene_type:complete
MSTLIERRDARKAEAQALADRFNTLAEESKKLENEKAQVHADFTVKNAQYAELEQMIKEEETTACSVETPQEG